MKIFDWIKKKKEPEKQTEEGNTSIVESDILDIEIKMPQTENTENIKKSLAFFDIIWYTVY